MFWPSPRPKSRSSNDKNNHINGEAPGSIHEESELGYALVVSFGAVMDKPDLIGACAVGGGEAETGPTATYVSEKHYRAEANKDNA